MAIPRTISPAVEQASSAFPDASAATLDVRILLFASYADAFGASEIVVKLLAPATTADALAAVSAMNGGEQLPSRPLVAVNARYARSDQLLADGDEVALIPPVAGG